MMEKHEITIHCHDMPFMIMQAQDADTGVVVANMRLSLGQYDIHDAIELGRRYSKLGNRVEIFEPKAQS